MDETFWTLLHDLPHWEFELFVSVVFMLVEGLIFWPLVRKAFKHHQVDDQDIVTLKKELESLNKRLSKLESK
jgi:uncharacterized protein YlxW (UPF0749 family)